MFVLYFPHRGEKVVVSGVPLDLSLYLLRYISKVADGVLPDQIGPVGKYPGATTPLSHWIKTTVKRELYSVLRNITAGAAVLDPAFIASLNERYIQAILEDIRIGYIYQDTKPGLSYQSTSAHNLFSNSQTNIVGDTDILHKLVRFSVGAHKDGPNLFEFLRVSIDSELRNTAGIHPISQKALTREARKILDKYTTFPF
uniref:VP11 n=1 Tax=viral metagenome TaxID=1070528 RepID=A0A2V0RAV3_9ZZZZ